MMLGLALRQLRLQIQWLDGKGGNQFKSSNHWICCVNATAMAHMNINLCHGWFWFAVFFDLFLQPIWYILSIWTWPISFGLKPIIMNFISCLLESSKIFLLQSVCLLVGCALRSRSIAGCCEIWVTVEISWTSLPVTVLGRFSFRQYGPHSVSTQPMVLGVKHVPTNSKIMRIMNFRSMMQ